MPVLRNTLVGITVQLSLRTMLGMPVNGQLTKHMPPNSTMFSILTYSNPAPKNAEPSIAVKLSGRVTFFRLEQLTKV